MRVYVTNCPRNGLNIGRKVGLCPGSRRRWVLGSVHAFSQAIYAAHTHTVLGFRLGPDLRSSFAVVSVRVVVVHVPCQVREGHLGFCLRLVSADG